MPCEGRRRGSRSRWRRWRRSRRAARRCSTRSRWRAAADRRWPRLLRRPATPPPHSRSFRSRAGRPKTGYDREQFGPAWSDVDRNGCDTRNDILKRDLAGETFKPGTHDCVVLTGTLDDPYTGKTIAFSRGQGTSEAVQIDHVVALSDAWQKGAQQLDAARADQPSQRPAEPPGGRRPDEPARATATRPPGCRRSARTAAPTSRGRWR